METKTHMENFTGKVLFFCYGTYIHQQCRRNYGIGAITDDLNHPDLKYSYSGSNLVVDVQNFNPLICVYCCCWCYTTMDLQEHWEECDNKLNKEELQSLRWIIKQVLKAPHLVYHVKLESLQLRKDFTISC